MGTAFPAMRAMFYLLSPSETYFQRVEDVPDYVVKVSSALEESRLLQRILRCFWV